MPPFTDKDAKPTGNITKLVIIGMRGAGKTSQGQVAASALGWRFVDVDAEIEKSLADSGKNLTIKQYVDTQGWPAFRDLELDVFRRVLARDEHTKASGIVVSCGGGIVETQPARDELASLVKVGVPVIFFQRDIDIIVDYLLKKDGSRPSFTEHPKDVFLRRSSLIYKRLPLYKQYSTHEFVVKNGDSDWQLIETEFINFIRQITGQLAANFVAAPSLKQTFEYDHGSFFLSLTYPDYSVVSQELLNDISTGVQALEVRVDLLQDHSPDYVGQQLAIVRRLNVRRLPIIFTVRTIEQGGKFPSNSEEKLFDLLVFGVRSGCEYIDVESGWSAKALGRITNLKKTHPNTFRIISSFHYYDPAVWEKDESVIKLFKQSYYPGVDIVKVVLQAFEPQTHAERIQHLSQVALPDDVPRIAICTGEKGKLARVLNRFFTPVTHPSLPVIAAPGQMSVADVNKTRTALGICSRKDFFLFGSPISASRSPLIHNTGFTIMGLPHQYNLFETTDATAISEVIRKPTTGGGSVTIPNKLAVIPLLDKLSPHATAIGAVNTIYKKISPDGKVEVWGDNTDFLGVKNLITPVMPKGTSLTAVVLGAGGTARAVLYALNSMNAEGYKIEKYLYNRTEDKATALAVEFGCHVLTSLTNPPNNLSPNIVISTLPPAAQQEIFTDENSSKFQWMFANCKLAMDLVYKPRITPMLKIARDNKVPTLVEGIEILLTQGYAQLELWGGSKVVPRLQIRTAVMNSVQDL